MSHTEIDELNKREGHQRRNGLSMKIFIFVCTSDVFLPLKIVK